MIAMRQDPRTSNKALRLRKERTLAASALASALSVVVLVLWSVLPKDQPRMAETSAGSQYSLTSEDLNSQFKAGLAAFRQYLKRDRTESELTAVGAQFSDLTSEGELVEALRQLFLAGKDDYGEILTDAAYQHRMMEQSGYSIGVDMEVGFDVKSNGVRVTKCGESVTAFGIKSGDEVTAVDGRDLTAFGTTDAGALTELVQELNERLKNRLLHSTVPVRFRHDGKLMEASLPRIALLPRAKAYSVSDMLHPETNKRVSDLKEVAITNLRHETIVSDLFRELTLMQEAKVQGLILDIRSLSEGDGATAARIAALFLEKGVIGRWIETKPDGTLVMRTYEIDGGRVHLRTKGPYKVTPGGSLDFNAMEPDKDETLDWQTNVFKGVVIVLVGHHTSGAGEVLAFALKHSSDTTKRAQVLAKFVPAGKGADQTYSPVGKYWIKLSTKIYLQPDGRDIKGQEGYSVGIAHHADEFNSARLAVVAALQVVPAPDYPPAAK